MPQSGREAVRQFSQLSGLPLSELDAIVASNDGMAIGVLSGLAELGIAVPAEIAVTGFDDAEEAGLMSPPLTTVRQPLTKIARLAARNLIEWMQTGVAPDDAVVATEVVVRRSCGCTDQSLSKATSLAPTLDYSFDAALIIRRQHILDRMTRAARGELGIAGADWQGRALTAFVAEFRGEKPSVFCHLLEDIAEKLAARGADIQPCHDVVDCLREQLSVYSEPARRTLVEDIFYKTHLTISETQRRGLVRSRFELGRSVRDISAACNRFASVADFRELRDRINEHLPHLGFRNYFVVVYTDGDPRQAKVLVACDQGHKIDSLPDNTFEASDLLPQSLLSQIGGGKAFAVLSLVWKEEILGHALFALDIERILGYDELAIALGTGIRSARIK